MPIKEASTKLIKTALNFFSVVLLFTSMFQPALAQLKPAAIIPDFTLYTMNGQVFTQKQLKSNSKILFLFFDATCPHCQYETQLISSHYKEFKNTVFYLVSMDKKPQIQKFVHTYGKDLEGKANVTLLADANRQFIERFTPSQFPALYIYNKDKKLLKYWDTPVGIDQIMNVIYQP
ncbi:MAG: peroxiredoxin family protein [Mucilaginibacter sp.]|uniref:peroxiredoxin family protein n=1 Tax=Mucilaginibacter sp. TaxID=1882438 RepID=UPI0034E4E37E